MNKKENTPESITERRERKGRLVREYALTNKPSFQDRIDRKKLFSHLAQTLEREGALGSSGLVYCPAANTQVDTRVFASSFPDHKFIGGDIVESAVVKGKYRTERDNKIKNASFIIADGLYPPFKDESFDVISDFHGAAWHAADNKKTKSLLSGYHKILTKGGRLVVDDYPQGGYPSTIDLMASDLPEVFGNGNSGKVEFNDDGYEVKFRIRHFQVVGENERCRAYVFEKE